MQLKKYYNDGYLSPIDILSLNEVKEIKYEIEKIEKKWPDQINNLNRNNIHYYSPIFDLLVHNKKILAKIGQNVTAGESLIASE